MKRIVYAAVGAVLLVVAGFMIYRALGASLVYFIVPSEYAAEPGRYEDRRLRLGGLVEAGSVAYDSDALQLAFHVTDGIATYPVLHVGTPPELFAENTGVVLEGRFGDDGTFRSDELLIRHSEVYQAPKDGEPVDVEALKEALE